MKNQSIGNSIDWITILIYIALVIMGWMTIYSASLPIEETSIFDLSQIYGRQMLFIGLAIPLIFIVLFTDAKIYASNDLDENTILNLKMQKAKIDVWGVGTKLITAYDQPALGAVYKIVSIEDENGNMRDTIKLSSNAEKVSTPGKKQVWRITSKEKGKSEGDYITFADTDVTHLDSIYMFHPTYTYINKTIENFEARPLLVPIFENGKQVYELPSLAEIQDYANKEIDKLWDEYKRVLNPQLYPVDLAQDVWDNKMKLINSIRQQSQAKAI